MSKDMFLYKIYNPKTNEFIYRHKNYRHWSKNGSFMTYNGLVSHLKHMRTNWEADNYLYKTNKPFMYEGCVIKKYKLILEEDMLIE